MQSDKTRIFIMALGTIMLLLGVVAWLYFANNNGSLNLAGALAMAVPLLLVIFMAFFIFRRYRDIKQGMPFEDERSKKVMLRAAGVSFYVSLYWLLIISFFEPFFAGLYQAESLDAGRTVSLGIIGMTIIFFICWAFYSRKSDL